MALNALSVNSASVCLGVSVLGGLALPGAATAAEDLDRSLAHYEALQRAMCVQDAQLATEHFQRLITPHTLAAYRYNNPVILMTPRCQRGMVVAISPRGQARSQRFEDAFSLPTPAPSASPQAEMSSVETSRPANSAHGNPAAPAIATRVTTAATPVISTTPTATVTPTTPTASSTSTVTPPATIRPVTRPQVTVVQVQAEAIALNPAPTSVPSSVTPTAPVNPPAPIAREPVAPTAIALTDVQTSPEYRQFTVTHHHFD